MTRKHRLRQALQTVRDLFASRDERVERNQQRQAVDLWVEFGGVEAARLLGMKEHDVLELVEAASHWYSDDT